MAYITFKLTKAHCHETEDYTGADEFYVVGLYTVVEKNSNNVKETGTPRISVVWSLNDGQSVPNLSYTIYDNIGFNPETDVVRFHIKCMDKDVASDLHGLPDNIFRRARDTANKAAEEVAEAKKKLAEEAKENGAFETLEEVASALNPTKGAIDVAEFALDTLWDIIYGGLSLDKDDFLGEEHFSYIPGATTVPAAGLVKEFECRGDGAYYTVAFTVTTA